MNHPAILETVEALGENTLIADPSQIVELCRYLRNDQMFVRLSAVTAVDWYPAEPRFEVVYHLHSLDRNARLRQADRSDIETFRRLHFRCAQQLPVERISPAVIVTT